MSDERKSGPTQSEAEAAVRTLIEWAGDDPDREGLLDTPGRVVRAYRELFSGYEADPRDYLKRTFDEVGGYDETLPMSYAEDYEFLLRAVETGRVGVVNLPLASIRKYNA